MASETRIWFSSNLDTAVRRDFKNLNQVPVVVAWKIAEKYAEKQGMCFRTPALQPRNPDNRPDDFERRALEAFVRDPSLGEFSEREVHNGKDVMRYARPVRLTRDCLVCHGTPAGEEGAYGFKKEGMKDGELKVFSCVLRAASPSASSMNPV